MAPDLDHPRPPTRRAAPASPAPAGGVRRPSGAAPWPGVPSGPPRRLPGPPAAGTRRPGPACPPRTSPDGAASPTRRRLIWAAACILATIAVAGVGVALALGDDDDRAAQPDTSSTTIPTTFAVDLSTGAAGPGGAAATGMPNPSPTLPLPSIWLPLPGATTVAPATAMPAGQPPGDLGDDAVLDRMADDCYAGDMTACDALVASAGAGTAYLAYGDSCAGRQPEHVTTPCAATFADAVPTTVD